jgi:hypothetical protein
MTGAPASPSGSRPSDQAQLHGPDASRFDPSRGGVLGETPILWRFRMQYAWNASLADEYPDWDQCCGCAEFAVSETEARRKIWSHFRYPGCVVPVSIASCEPERYENDHDASAIEARSDAAPKSDAAEGESAAPSGETPK